MHIRNNLFSWRRIPLTFSLRDTAVTVAIILSATGICALLNLFSTSDTYASMIFLLAVVLVARSTGGYLYGFIASIIGVFAVNFAFMHPYLNFNLSLSGYPLTFTCMLAVSLIVSTMTTQLKQQEKERYARQAEEMRGNLLRAVSHDLRTPLTSIQGAASILAEQMDRLPAERRLSLLRQIEDDSAWLIRMVENLLSVTRINADSTRVHKRMEAAEEVIAETVRKFRSRHPSLPVEIRLPDDFLLVPMDPLLIEQVISNLLENAALHAAGATRVTLRLSSQGDDALFEIMDDGNGIDPALLPVLFSGMIKPAAPSSDSGKSMGIGLSVCRTIIAAHGGTMSAINRPEGGALFRFTLPIKEENHESENHHPAR